MTTHYLRNNSKLIVDVEVTNGDLCCIVLIDGYSDFLLSSAFPQSGVIVDFTALQELRGAYWENPVKNESANSLVEKRLRYIATKYKLNYSVD